MTSPPRRARRSSSFSPARSPPHAIDAVLAAHAGFCLADAVHPPPRGLEPVYAAKLALGLGTIRWLQRRLDRRG